MKMCHFKVENRPFVLIRKYLAQTIVIIQGMHPPSSWGQEVKIS